MAAKPKGAVAAAAPTAAPATDAAPPRTAAADPRRVLAHFVLNGPSFERRLAVVVNDRGGGVLDLRVELEHGRSILLERVEKRPLPQVIAYPSWEEAPAAA